VNDCGVTVTLAFQLDTRDEARQSLEFYHHVLRPLIDVYAVSALGLQRLVGRQLTEQDYMQELLQEMRTQLKMGFAQYGENSHVESPKQNVTSVTNSVAL
jgi:hypothetical protein